MFRGHRKLLSNLVSSLKSSPSSLEPVLLTAAKTVQQKRRKGIESPLVKVRTRN